MTGREMIHAAARAAASLVRLDNDGNAWDRATGAPWLPRSMDGDSFRLAACLRICVEHNQPQEPSGWVIASIDDGKVRSSYLENVPDESQRADAMRLAILRCAASQKPATALEAP